MYRALHGAPEGSSAEKTGTARKGPRPSAQVKQHDRTIKTTDRTPPITPQRTSAPPTPKC